MAGWCSDVSLGKVKNSQRSNMKMKVLSFQWQSQRAHYLHNNYLHIANGLLFNHFCIISFLTCKLQRWNFRLHAQIVQELWHTDGTSAAAALKTTSHVKRPLVLFVQVVTELTGKPSKERKLWITGTQTQIDIQADTGTCKKKTLEGKPDDWINCWINLGLLKITAASWLVIKRFVQRYQLNVFVRDNVSEGWQKRLLTDKYK